MMETTILHVEDSTDDVLLVSTAFRKANAGLRIEVAADGEAAVNFLEKRLPEELPAAVLLDLKLPRKSGLEVLEWMRSQQPLRRLPVVVLTSSSQPADINRAYELGANSYLVKPADLQDLIELARLIDRYWLRTNVAPTLVA